MASPRENLRKALLYLQWWDAYWRLSDPSEQLVLGGSLAAYPTDLRPRLVEGHYVCFDPEGIPCIPKEAGKQRGYDFTTMLSYALARWHLYLGNPQGEHLQVCQKVAAQVVRTSESDGRGGRILRENDDSGRPCGEVSAMSLGEAMSLFCRLWQATKDNGYLDTARQFAVPFTRSTEDDGVVGTIGNTGIRWYEEYTKTPLRHVLNGMVYSVWGLMDLAQATGDTAAVQLRDAGLESLSQAMRRRLFDVGWWSLYCITDDGVGDYMASMMYHNLHICQLTAIGRQTGRPEFFDAADRFREYAGSLINRLRAGMSVLKAKTVQAVSRKRAKTGGRERNEA